MHDKYEAVVIWGSGLLSKNKAFLPSSDLKLVYMIASWLDMTTGGQRLFPIVSFLSSSLCEKSTYGMYVEDCLCLGLKTVCFFYQSLSTSNCQSSWKCVHGERKCVMLFYSSKTANEVPVKQALNT